ncbi:P-II family nitrogen regulator [Erysipelothrix urinaevulpis]|uniref:P-II family nitrogen regulator n=1 Tax=Erysipelothrix urinaevulpis TaxID=2683717 RepID=UPI00135A5DF2|nr:P-II family nitrogen regulator [Erysipelothrix urinaevulpis]
MHTLVLVLNKADHLEDILNGLMEIGVKGATILDSQGMGSAIMVGDGEDSSFFGTLKSSFDREHPYNKTIFTVIESEELLHQAMNKIKKVAGDLSQPGEGLMFVLPVSHVMGLAANK